MKRKVFILAALLLAAVACAETEQFWSADGDLYYHSSPCCMERNDLSPVADTDGKYPCYVCVQDDTDYGGVTGVYSGDFMMLRVPDTASDGLIGWHGIFADTTAIQKNGPYGVECLAQDVHGDAYVACVESKLAGSDFEHRVITPSYFDDRFSGTEKCRRHIGGAWYIVMDMSAYLRYDDYCATHTWTGTARYFTGRVFQEDGVFFSQCTDEVSMDMTIPLADAGECLNAVCGGLTAEIWRLDGADLCVITDRSPEGQYYYGYSTLRINGMPVLTGDPRSVTDAATGEASSVLWCALTDAESEAILNGAEFDILYDVEYSLADYENTDHALVCVSSAWAGQYILLDRHGDTVMTLGYEARRVGDLVFSLKQLDDDGYELTVTDLSQRKDVAVISGDFSVSYPDDDQY